MNAYRQRVIAELAKNNIFVDSSDKTIKVGECARPEGATFINGAILDGSIYLYNPKRSLWGNYEDIYNDPLPFMIFLLKLLEWKKSMDNGI